MSNNTFTYRPTRRGGKVLIYQNHEYGKHKTTTEKITYWRCIKRSATNCKSILHTKGVKIVKFPAEHTCEKVGTPNSSAGISQDESITENLTMDEDEIEFSIVGESLQQADCSFESPEISTSVRNQLLDLQLKTAKLEREIKEEELHLVRKQRKNEEEFHNLKIKILQLKYENMKKNPQ